MAEIARFGPTCWRAKASRHAGLRDLAGLALRDPAGFATYAAVSVAVKAGRSGGWTRGR